MGMAASQARLLTITARLADNELRSQTINNAKMRLATQSSQASENYINALNDAALKFSNYDEAGNEQSQLLTFNSLMAYSSYNTQYGLVNSSGQLLVSEAEAKMFEDSKGNLNAYLKAHGLEYTTTYFDQIGTYENAKYPEPFNSIEAETLKSYYEQYNSYQNSTEVEQYKNNYSVFDNANKELINASKQAITNYLLCNNNSPKIYVDSSSKETIINITNASAQGIISDMKNAFTGSNNNTYNIENLKNNKFISQEIYDEIVNELNSYQNWSGQLPNSGDSTYYSGVIYKAESSFSYDANNKKYTIDDLTISVDDAGNVTEIKGAETVTEDDITYTYSYPAVDGTVSLKDFLNGLSYCASSKDESGNDVKYYYQYSATTAPDGSVAGANLGMILTNPSDVKTEMNSLAEAIVEFIKSEANYENFADFLLTTDPNDLKNTYGIDVNANIGTSNKTLNSYLQEYKDAKSIFLDNIFDASSIATVEQDLKDGAQFTNADGETFVVTPENLTDIDFVLQYIKVKGLKQSESFNTVIKEYLVEDMIANYGEPKYAWVDENDTSNKGNADAKAQWYTNLFNRMLKGYKALENGLASSAEWIEYALENGIISMEQVDKSYNWDGLDYKSCTKITEETVQDAVTKAEAEYNRAMNDIEAKDNIYDVELKNIDTEHTSLQTEYESIKSVISKNIERTFKFNQSA